jgi:exosortase
LSSASPAVALPSFIKELEAVIRRIGPLGLALAALFAILYFDPARVVWRAWTKENGYYSHGPLVPLVAAGMVYLRREELKKIPLRTNWWGLPILITCSLVFLASTLCHMYPPKYVAFVFYLLGFNLLLFGSDITRATLLPWAFLFFMVPLPDGVIDVITYKLRIYVTAAAVAMSEPFDWYVVKSGNLIHFQNGDTLVVGDVCAGLRSLISLLALGAVFSCTSNLNAWGSLALFVLSVPVAILTNILRIFGLIVVAQYWGSSTASGKIHDASGWAIFAVAFCLLYLLYMALEKIAGTSAERQQIRGAGA